MSNGKKWAAALTVAACLLGNQAAQAAEQAPEQAAKPAAEPAFYDARLSVPTDRSSGYDPTRALVNPIRNQGGFGTCWAFSSVAAMESNLYLQLQQAGIPYNVEHNDVDLSEWYLAWVSVASPTGVDPAADPVSHSDLPEKGEHFLLPFVQRAYQGGNPFTKVELMSANAASFCAEQPGKDRDALLALRAPEQYGAQAAYVGQLYTDFSPLTMQDREKCKAILRRCGIAVIALDAFPLTAERWGDRQASDFYAAKPAAINHGVTLVGWDDAYDFSNSGLAVKPKEKGAWILRNSWGTGWADHGYAHLSYEEATASLFMGIEAIPDTGDFSRIARHENNMRDVGPCGATDALVFGSGHLAAEDSFLKRVGFSTLSDGTSYTIEVRRGSQRPDEGTVVLHQEGTFGEDGSPAWGGYRTVELNKYVYLSQSEPYCVTVALSQKQKDRPVLSLLVVPLENRTTPAGITSYLQDTDTKTWWRAFDPELPEAVGHGSVLQRGYLKGAYEAMGHDFTVASLENSAAVTVPTGIYLGRADELYGKDRCHPDRRTLANLTADIAGMESYSGSIRGEGSLTKAGAGTLTLTGASSYTGGTRVAAGVLRLAPRANGGEAVLAGDVLIEAGAGFGGAGAVGGSVRGSGQLLLGAGCLTLGGQADLTGLTVQLAEKPAAGTAVLKAAGGIIGDVPAALMRSEDGTALLVR